MGKPSNKQVTKTELPDELKGPTKQALSAATGLFEGGGPQVFQGDRFAGPTETQLEGRRLGIQTAQNAATGIADVSRTALEDQLTLPDDIRDDPVVARAIEAQNASLKRTFREEVLPGIGDAAQNAGAFGGARSQIRQEQAGGRLLEAQAQGESAITSRALSDRLAGRTAALGLSGQVQQQQFAPAAALEDIGRLEQGDQQQQIQADRQKFEEEQFRQEDALDRLIARISGVPQTRNTTQIRDVGGSPFTRGLGTALSIFGG